MNAPADVHVLLIGRTGQGRSATGNSILERNAFKTSSSPLSMTSEIECGISEFNSQRVKVVDGPGVGHTHVSKQRAVNLYQASMEYAIAANPHGYDAFLIVVKFGVKYTKEVKETVDCFRKVFGQDFVRNFCILVVTSGDLFMQESANRGKSFEKWIDEHPGDFRDLVNECERRVILFDNVTTVGTIRNEQVQKLLKMVGNLKSKGNRYTDEDFAHAKEERQRYFVEAQKALIQKEVLKETNLILNESDNLQFVKELEIKMVRLRALQIRAHNLFTKIALQDNGTGVLNEMIDHVRWMQEYLDDQIAANVKVVNERGTTKQQVDSTHFVEEVPLTEDSDATIVKELLITYDMKAANKRQKLAEANNSTDRGEIDIRMRQQNEHNQLHMISNHTKDTDDEETSVCRVLEHTIGAGSNKVMIQLAGSNQVDLLLIGHSGMGMSETGNSILRRRAFLGRCKTCHVTNRVAFAVSEFNGRVIKVVDSPGIEELEQVDFDSVIRAMQTANAINPRGYNAFLLVFRCSHKISAKYQFTIEVLKSIFGQDFLNRFCIMVLTGGDCFEGDNEETDKFVQQWCNEQEEEFKDLVKECENRIVIFDNLTKDLAKKNRQIENLLKVVDKLKSKGKRYSAENVANAKEFTQMNELGLS